MTPRILRASAGARLLLALALPLALSGCGGSELRAAERVLETAAPLEYAAWKAANEALEIASQAVPDKERFLARQGADALEREMAEAEDELNARIQAAVELRNEKLQVAQAAQQNYVHTWNERKDDLRFERSGHGIGVGNAARFVIREAEAAANRTRREFEAADADADRVTAAAQAEFDVLVSATEEAFTASLSPAMLASIAASDAADAAAAKLEQAAPEAWAALQARTEQLAAPLDPAIVRRERRETMALVLLVGLLLCPVLGIIPGRIARKKGRSFWAWWAYGGLLPLGMSLISSYAALVPFPLALVHALSLKAEACPSCGAYSGGQSLACRSCGEALP